MNSQPEKVVIACRSLEPELELAAKLADKEDSDETERLYLDQNLHRTPDSMPAIIQESVDEAAARPAVETIVLGYGLCSNGVVGVRAPRQGLYVPRAHDCITFFLGSQEDYHREFNENPGSYYLTPGWIAEQKDPLGIIENEYTERVGPEEAEEAMRLELQHYTRIVLVRSEATDDIEALRQRAQENARFLGKEYKEIEGGDSYFRKILFGPYNENDFVFVAGGEKVEQKVFL